MKVGHIAQIAHEANQVLQISVDDELFYDEKSKDHLLRLP